MGVDLSQIRNQVIRQMDETVYSVEVSDNTTAVNLTVVLISRRLEQKIDRLTAILTEAKKLIGEIESQIKIIRNAITN